MFLKSGSPALKMNSRRGNISDTENGTQGPTFRTCDWIVWFVHAYSHIRACCATRLGDLLVAHALGRHHLDGVELLCGTDHFVRTW